MEHKRVSSFYKLQKEITKAVEESKKKGINVKYIDYCFQNGKGLSRLSNHAINLFNRDDYEILKKDFEYITQYYMNMTIIIYFQEKAYDFDIFKKTYDYVLTFEREGE